MKILRIFPCLGDQINCVVLCGGIVAWSSGVVTVFISVEILDKKWV